MPACVQYLPVARMFKEEDFRAIKLSSLYLSRFTLFILATRVARTLPHVHARACAQGVCDRDSIDINIRDLMRTWLTCERFPVLYVRMADEGSGDILNITQQPFSFYGVSGDEGAGPPTKVERAAGTGHGGSAPGEEVNSPATATNPQEGRVIEGGTSVDPTSVGRTGDSLTSSTTKQQEVFADNSCDRTVGGLLRWVIPLRIRVGTGSPPPPLAEGNISVGAPAGAAQPIAGDGGHEPTQEVKHGEEIHSVMMTQRSMSVIVHGVSDGAKQARYRATGNAALVAGEGSSDERAVQGRPYLVINDGHSGFFTVQYACERSWSLALAALENGVLSYCEAMGFVHDLILGLHEGVLVDRGDLGIAAETDSLRMSKVINTADEAAGRGSGERRRQTQEEDGQKYCSVSRLFTRLQEVVRLLSRDLSHPAWCPGQLFVWELLLVCASNALADFEAHQSRRMRESLAAANRRIDDLFAREKAADFVPGPIAEGGRVSADAPEEGTGGLDKKGGREAPAARGGSASRAVEPKHRGRSSTSSSPMEVDAIDDDDVVKPCQRKIERHRRQAELGAPAAAATADGPTQGTASPLPASEGQERFENNTPAFARNGAYVDEDPHSERNVDIAAAKVLAEATLVRFHFTRILRDLRQATREVEEHVLWHDDRISRGEEQAAEPRQSLAAMRDRMTRMVQSCEAQLSPPPPPGPGVGGGDRVSD